MYYNQYWFTSRGLVGSKNLTATDMDPVLEKLKEHLVTKNVAIEIATKLCDSVSSKLEGKVKILFFTKNIIIIHFKIYIYIYIGSWFI